MELHEALAAKVDAWREAGYPSDSPALAEILDYATEDVEPGAPWPRSGRLRFLRAAQLRALETCWYLRVVEQSRGRARTAPIPLIREPLATVRLTKRVGMPTLRV